MLSLRIVVTSEAIRRVKADLTKSLPTVKSSHRVEALARALGFSTHASLLAAMKTSSEHSANLDWKQYDLYLRDHGFNVSAVPLFIAVGRESIRQMLEKEPFLTMDGISRRPWLIKNGRRESVAEHAARFTASRVEFFEASSVEQVLRAAAFVSVLLPAKKPDEQSFSYSLKHKAEKFVSKYPDGTKLGPDYVSQGAFIVAAILGGFSYKECDDDEEVSFNFSRESLRLSGDANGQPKGPQLVQKHANGKMKSLLKHLSEEMIQKIITFSEAKRAAATPSSPEEGALSVGEWLNNYPEESAKEWNQWGQAKKKLFDLIKTLNAGERMELTALTLIGRGDTVIEPSISAKQNFLSLSEEFKENMDDDHINYLIEKPLHTYLREALALDPSDLVPDI